MRVKKRWNQNDRPRTIAQMSNAIAATIWKTSSQVVLNLENENFETVTQAQRIDVMEEIVCFLIHFADRWVYDKTSAENRAEFVSALAKDLARMFEDSRIDVQGAGEYQQAFIGKLNQRSSGYAEYAFSPEEGASFSMQRELGALVSKSMGERDNKWISDYIMGREAPEIESGLRRSLVGLVVFNMCDS